MQLKSSLKRLEDNGAFFEAYDAEARNNLAATMKDSTRLSQLVEEIGAEMVGL